MTVDSPVGDSQPAAMVTTAESRETLPLQACLQGVLSKELLYIRRWNESHSKNVRADCAQSRIVFYRIRICSEIDAFVSISEP